MFVWPTSHIGMLHPAGDERAQGRARDFLTFAQAAKDEVSYEDAKELLTCSSHQAETRKSLFEELGLLYVPYRSNRIVLTPLGEQFHSTLHGKDLDKLTVDVARQATALLVWAQTRVQINRPQSRGVPKPTPHEWQTCDVKPYAAAWLAAQQLDGKLFLHEFMGVLRYIHKASDFAGAVEKIKIAREKSGRLADSRDWKNRGPAMNYVIYWRSHLSVAQKLMSWDEKTEVLEADADVWDIANAALRFQSGCEGNAIQAITSSTWANPEEYFLALAGAACPPFLAGGRPTLTDFNGQTLADLRNYKLEVDGPSFNVLGGPELCSLSLKMQCFHPFSPGRLLRIDGKSQHSSGAIRLELGLGRPITDLSLLERALGKHDA